MKNSVLILEELLNYLRISANKLSVVLGHKNNTRIYHVKNGRNKISPDLAKEISEHFPKVSYAWLLTGEGSMLKSEYTQKEAEPIHLNEPESNYGLINRNELEPKKYEGQTPVKVVSTNAQAGWSDAYYSQEYLKDMPTVLIESDENYKGQYLAFEVQGESMETDYYAGDIVICREVQRHLWASKLHYNEYDYVIAHGTQGVMLKEITSHNLETGEVVCHSLHPAHKDFTLNLREVAFLYNVVEVRQKGKNKKRNR